MKRSAVASGVLLVLGIYGGLAFGYQPPERWFDADLRPLAMSVEEGYCSGLAVYRWFKPGGKEFVERCVAELEAAEDGDAAGSDALEAAATAIPATVRSSEDVQEAFCHGLRDRSDLALESCLRIVVNFEYWPLLHAGYTGTWDEANPYPLEEEGSIFDRLGSVAP